MTTNLRRLYKNILVIKDEDGNTLDRRSMQALPPFTAHYPAEPGAEITVPFAWYYTQERFALDSVEDCKELHQLGIAGATTREVETWECVTVHDLYDTYDFAEDTVYTDRDELDPSELTTVIVTWKEDTARLEPAKETGWRTVACSHVTLVRKIKTTLFFDSFFE